LLVAVMLCTYVIFEPIVGSAASDQFTISQTVTSEVAFLTATNDVTMNGSIAGLTGGTATGQTQVRVVTNDNSGYSMTIEASSSPAMQGDTTSGEIPDYTPSTPGTPDYAFSVAANTAEFGYTVSASTTSDLAQKFKDNGSTACGTGSSDTNGSATCWYNLATTTTTLVNRTTYTPSSGATTTIYFKTQIQSNPSPIVPEDTYTATTTLTAVTN
jgi:hypothetical protein